MRELLSSPVLAGLVVLVVVQCWVAVYLSASGRASTRVRRTFVGAAPALWVVAMVALGARFIVL